MFSAVNNGKIAISGKRFMYPALDVYGIACCVAHLCFGFIWQHIKII